MVLILRFCFLIWKFGQGDGGASGKCVFTDELTSAPDTSAFVKKYGYIVVIGYYVRFRVRVRYSVGRIQGWSSEFGKSVKEIDAGQISQEQVS